VSGLAIEDRYGQVIDRVAGATLAEMPSVLRTFVLATVAVPIVIYGLMPRLHKIRAYLFTRRATV
jgi:hypothetical protein